MPKSLRSLADLLRALLLLVLLPLALLLAGPLLVAAALFRRVSLLGVLQLEPGKRHRRGRWWAFAAGVILWGLTWAGAVRLLPPGYLPNPVTAGLTVQTPPPPTETPAASPTRTPLPAPTFTPTPVLAPGTPTPTPPPPSPTAPPAATDTPTPAATAAPTPTVTPPPNTPLPPLPPGIETGALQALARANNLLVNAVQSPGNDTLTALAAAWRGQALIQVQTFVRRIEDKYRPPVKATYSTIGLPRITPAANLLSLQVESREHWVFEDALGKKEALTVYVYTLEQQGGRWVIVAYRFEAAPEPG